MPCGAWGAGRIAAGRPSQGVHLVLPDTFLPGSHALMVPRTDDGRVLFIVPWHKRALVGTTDTPVDQVSADPRPLEEEVAFLLDHASRYLARDPKREDVLSVYVGLRPLVRHEGTGTTAKLSRDHSIFEARAGWSPSSAGSDHLPPDGRGRGGPRGQSG
jgi:glycerol-3-phosphate dehydrogenase